MPVSEKDLEELPFDERQPEGNGSCGHTQLRIPPRGASVVSEPATPAAAENRPMRPLYPPKLGKQSLCAGVGGRQEKRTAGSSLNT